MRKSLTICLAVICLLIAGTFQPAECQLKYPTLIPMQTINDMVNVVSGTVPFNVMQEIAAFNRDRKADEYRGMYHESKVILKHLQEFGYSDAVVETYETSMRGRGKPQQWDAETGDLWMVSPEEKLIISHRDIPAALAPGSKSADVTAELVYVENGVKDSDYEGIDVKGKIVLVSGSGSGWGRTTGGAYRIAVNKLGALGVVSFRSAQPYDRPDQIPWASIHGEVKEGTFGFNLPFRIGDDLKNRLVGGEKITVRAFVKTNIYEVDNEIPTAVIKGTGESDQEVILIAHLFEGISKQGANDNISGCAAILEAGRTINELIKQGKIERPKRTIRFLFVPEISGTYQYLQRHPDIAKRAIAGINMDMVGEDVKKNRNSLWLTLSPHSLQSFVNDFAEHFFHFVGYTNREVYPQITRTPYPLPIIDPNGSQDQFYYLIDKYAGGSDHIVLQAPQYKIPTAYYNNWPDMHYHSSEDRPDKSDPTQMKRVAFLGAVVAYTIANGGPGDLPLFISECSGKSLERTGRDLKACLNALANAKPEALAGVYKEQNGIMNASFDREAQNIRSLTVFTGGKKSAQTLIDDAETAFIGYHAPARGQIQSFYRDLCKKYSLKPAEPGLTDAEKEASKLKPADLQFEKMSAPRVQVKGLSRSMYNELLCFVDGKRSVLDIRNLVSAEFHPVPVEAVMQYYKQLVEKKFLTLK